MKKLVGIIGGMGPMASQLFYKMVTEMTAADRDQDHLNMLIYSDASMPDRTSAILENKYDEVYAQLLADARVLEKSGCKAIGITCNTAYFFGDMMRDELKVPLIHMIQETAEKVAETAKSKKVAILATDGTIKTELYQTRFKDVGVEPFILPENMQKIIMYQIYDRIKNGKSCDEVKWKEIDAYLRDSGCENAVLACTELSIVKEEIKLDNFYIDPMRLLAKRIIEAGGGKLKNFI